MELSSSLPHGPSVNNILDNNINFMSYLVSSKLTFCLSTLVYIGTDQKEFK